MANTIKLKRSSTANSVPTAGSLEYGELALNYTDGNLFFKTAGNAVTLIASTQTANYSGNITANYFIGNANIQYTASTAPTTGNLIGAQWYNTTTGALYEWQSDGTSTYWIDVTGPVIGSVSAEATYGNANVAAYLPTYSGNLSPNIVVATGNITGGNLSGTSIVGTLTTAAQTNITSLGTLSSLGVTGNTTSGNVISTGAVYSNYNTNTANTASFMATGGNTKGGTGYLDFLNVRNTSGGATNPNKWLRTNSTGTLEIVNSAYSSTIFSITDSGTLNVVGPLQISGAQAVNGPAFSAYAAATLQTIPNNAQTKVLFQTEEFDTNSNYTNSTFTPTVAGYYQLNAEVRLDGASGTGECMIILYKNGAEYKRGWNSSGTQFASSFWAMTVSSLAYANGTGDYFEIYVQQGSGGNLTVTAVNNSAITWFNGCMLRGA